MGLIGCAVPAHTSPRASNYHRKMVPPPDPKGPIRDGSRKLGNVEEAPDG